MASRIEILNEGGKLFVTVCTFTAKPPGLRHDARRPYELRSLSFQLLPHPHADGSATVSQGLTSVQVVIYGPREPKSRSNSHPDKAVISVEVGVVPWAQSGGAKKSRGDR
jgi:exosome complex component RRP41